MPMVIRKDQWALTTQPIYILATPTKLNKRQGSQRAENNTAAEERVLSTPYASSTSSNTPQPLKTTTDANLPSLVGVPLLLSRTIG